MKNKIKLYPMDSSVISNSAEVSPAKNFIPEWYKKIPHFTNGESKLRIKFGTALNSTIKRCSPFLDAISSGYMITCPIDIHISWKEDIIQINYDSDLELISDHSLEQKSHLPTPEGYYEKIQKWNNYFAITLPKGYSLWCTHPSNRFDLPFITLNGFVDSDSYDLPIQFPFYIKKGWTGTIKSGTPLAQILPVKRDSWILEQLESKQDETTSRIFKYFSTIERSYKKKHWSKKEYN